MPINAPRRVRKIAIPKLCNTQRCSISYGRTLLPHPNRPPRYVHRFLMVVTPVDKVHVRAKEANRLTNRNRSTLDYRKNNTTARWNMICIMHLLSQTLKEGEKVKLLWSQNDEWVSESSFFSEHGDMAVGTRKLAEKGHFWVRSWCLKVVMVVKWPVDGNLLTIFGNVAPRSLTHAKDDGIWSKRRDRKNGKRFDLGLWFTAKRSVHPN